MGNCTHSCYLIESISDNTDEFPNLGLRLSFILRFAKDFKSLVENKTTNELKDTIISHTLAKRCSYCEYINDNYPGAVAVAKVFISHAWKYKFLDVIDALKTHFANDLDIPIWFDLFSNNQHTSFERPFEWWSNTFKSAIQQFQCTVMVVTPWNDPIPLTRGWCIWELYCSIQTNCVFEIAMSGANEKKFISDVDRDPNAAVNEMLANIDCENSECSQPEDKNAIHEAIKQNTGFSEMNKVIFKTIGEWIIRKYSKEFEKRQLALGGDHSSTLRSMRNLAGLYERQGKYDEAEVLYKSCLEKRRSIQGEDHPNTLQSMNNLAGLYERQGKYDAAEVLYETCLEKMKSKLGDDHPDTLASMNGLAGLYISLDKYDGAEVLYMSCLEKTRSRLGENHSDTLASMNGLAVVYGRKGKYEKAELLYMSCLEKTRYQLGENHLDTLTAMNNLAVVYDAQGKYDAAEVLYASCLEKTRSRLGEDHPETLTSINNLAGLYFKKGNYDEAESLFVYMLEKLRSKLGDNHPDTLTMLNNLAALYERKRQNGTADAEKRRYKIGADFAGTIEIVEQYSMKV